MFPDGYAAFPQTFDDTDPTVVIENGRKLIKAGTIWPSNGSLARGVIFYDCDVTDGTATGAVLFKAAIKISKIPAPPTTAARTALNDITWFA
jgi:hypothetical protein